LKGDNELEPFVRLIEALEPWLEEVALIGGWAHRLYRLDPRAQGLTYPPLTALDSDIAVPGNRGRASMNWMASPCFGSPIAFSGPLSFGATCLRSVRQDVDWASQAQFDGPLRAVTLF
jgi:hypothetical protein